jgi:DNA modification methylase
MQTLEDGSVDLIYLDPPFFSNRNYEIIWGDAGEIRSFEDRWAGGIDHYIGWLKERVEQMYRLLKKTGSIFLHCDWHACANIRVEILDKIFGMKNFRNEIVWHYTGWNKKLSDSFEKRHDVIYFYAKNNNTSRFNGYSKQWESEEEYIKKRKQKVRRDRHGAYVLSDGGNGQRVKRYIQEAMQYGSPIDDVWEFDKINNSSKERIGYPTQKPEALLERIIKCASNEGDVVLDPFIGGGTTAVVADRLRRRWIGIDQSVQAVKVTELRLDKERDFFSDPFSVQLHKYDYETLRHKDAFEFESWIIRQFGGTSNTKQHGDLGLDGKMPDNTPIQAKRQDNVGRNVVDNFFAAVRRSDMKLYEKNKKEKKPVGYIIAFSFGKGAVEEVARLKLKENVVIKLVEVAEIVSTGTKPTITVKMREVDRDAKGACQIEFSAKGHSAAGIEFYAWDFDHDAEKGFKPLVVREMDGHQTHQFKAGVHTIAVKAVDNDGLESMETITLKVNGTIKKL